MFNDELAQRIIQISRLGYYSPPGYLLCPQPRVIMSSSALIPIQIFTSPEVCLFYGDDQPSLGRAGIADLEHIGVRWDLVMNYKSTGHIYEETQSPAVIGINHAIIVVTILAEIHTFIAPLHPPIIKFYLMLDTQNIWNFPDTSELDVTF